MSGSGNDVWFSITPRNGYDLFITIYGEGSGGTLKNPVVKLFNDCSSGLTVVGSSNSVNNVTTFYAGGLSIGRTYYFSVSGSNTGSFKLCYQNQIAGIRPGQDCGTAKFLCSMDVLRETNISGAGFNPDEAAGSCLQNNNADGSHPNSETNSVWYKWRSANNGSLVFTITPTVSTDDLDWVLYDMGTTDNCSNKGVAIRCTNGSGVKNNLSKSEGGGCPNEPVYYKIGLDFNSTDLSEPKGCGQGQDGKVKFVDMQQNHIYALLINSPHQQGNGFVLEFLDQNGKAGTGIFAGPQAKIDFQANNECTTGQNYILKSLSTGHASLKWNFGEGANMAAASTEGPFTITYATKGVKTVSLEAIGTNGCYTLATQTFSVGLTPTMPTASVNKPVFCMKDTIILSASELPGLTYKWAGPGNFTSTMPEVKIPIKSNANSGVYTLIAFDGDCPSAPANLTVPTINPNPVAAFHTSPGYPVKLSLPATINFINDSKASDLYLWDFGDGTTSTELNPVHTYQSTGSFSVSLTSFKSNICNSSVTHGTFVIRADNTVFIPNTFTPNGDGFNDELVVSIVNISSYKIQIFNRLGAQVFSSTNIFENWKGTYKGQPLPVGTYYYVIDTLGLTGTPTKLSGFITLVR